MRPRRPLAVAALAAVLLPAAATASAATGHPASAPGTDKCGGALADYVGDEDELDAPFAGMLNDGGTLVPFTLTPRDSAGVVRAEFEDPEAVGAKSVESAATVSRDYAGEGGITFLTPHGSASSDEVVCGLKGSSRVTELTGTILVGRDHLEVFVLHRRKSPHPAPHPSRHSTKK